MATPTALLVASGEGARLGIFFKGYQGLEASHHVDTVVLDKTGTVTEGQMVVTDAVGAPGVSYNMLLRWAGALEQPSEHLIARAVTSAAQIELGALPPVEGFRTCPALAHEDTVEGHEISVGRAELFALRSPYRPTSSLVAWNGKSLGRTAVLRRARRCRRRSDGGCRRRSDRLLPRPFRELRALGLRCVLLTGDNECTARAVGAAIGVTEVIAGALPSDKVAVDPTPAAPRVGPSPWSATE